MNALTPKYRKFMWFGSLVVLAALVLAACTPGEIPATGATATTAPMPTSPPAATDTMAPEPTDTSAPAATGTSEPEAAMDEAELNVASDPELGEILVGNDGMTLYMFTRDEPNTVNCAGDCLVQWPPLITQGEPVLGEGVDPDLVGTAELPDGQMIVTYNEMPLYYWVADTQPGDTTGQGVGGVWFVVSPEGEIIGMEATEAAPAASPTEAPTDDMYSSGGSVAGMPDISVVEDPNYGEILVGENGMTLYIFTNDGPNTVNCSGNCLENWPPLVVDGEPVLGEGVDASLIGSAELPDGQMIVTYNQMPLYYWVNDTQAGDTTGQGVGGVWFVVSPEGEIIR